MLLPRDRALLQEYEKRQFGVGYGYGSPYGRSNWYDWGRWVLLGAIILVFAVFFILCSCLSARRRRKFGQAPYRGTGWLAPQHGPVQYYAGQQEQQHAPAPQQQTPYNQGYYSNQPAPPYVPNDGNRGNNAFYGQENGVELQPPNNTYQPQTGGSNVYQPPSGPPPNGKRDIVA